MKTVMYTAVCVLTIASVPAMYGQTAGTAPSPADPAHDHAQQQSADNPPPAGSTSAESKMSRQQMMKHQKMMAAMEARAANLEALRTRMNETDGEAQIDAVVALLNALVRNHADMHEHMMQMHSSMDHAPEPAK